MLKAFADAVSLYPFPLIAARATKAPSLFRGEGALPAHKRRFHSGLAKMPGLDSAVGCSRCWAALGRDPDLHSRAKGGLPDQPEQCTSPFSTYLTPCHRVNVVVVQPSHLADATPTARLTSTSPGNAWLCMQLGMYSSLAPQIDKAQPPAGAQRRRVGCSEG